MADISSLTVASRKMYFFAIYVLNHLREKEIIKIQDSFDVLSLDTALVNDFDPAVIQEMFKPKPKPKAKKSNLVRPITNAEPENVLETIANEFYANASDAVNAVPTTEKPKRKYNKKTNKSVVPTNADDAVAVTQVAPEAAAVTDAVVADIVSEIVDASKMDLKTTKPKKRKGKSTNEEMVTNNVDVAIVEEAKEKEKPKRQPKKKVKEPEPEPVIQESELVTVTEVVDMPEVVEEPEQKAVPEPEPEQKKAKRQSKKKAPEPDAVVAVTDVVTATVVEPEEPAVATTEKKAKKQSKKKVAPEPEPVVAPVEIVPEQKKAKKQSKKKSAPEPEPEPEPVAPVVTEEEREKENINPRTSTPIMPTEDEDSEDEIEARIITYSDGKQYLLSDDNTIYDINSYEVLGYYDAIKFKITFV